MVSKHKPKTAHSVPVRDASNAKIHCTITVDTSGEIISIKNKDGKEFEADEFMPDHDYTILSERQVMFIESKLKSESKEDPNHKPGHCVYIGGVLKCG